MLACTQSVMGCLVVLLFLFYLRDAVDSVSPALRLTLYASDNY